MLDDALKAQLQQYLGMLRQPIRLIASLDDSSASQDMRGLLEHEYGVKPSDIKWRRGGLEEGGREERAKITLPPDVERHGWLERIALAVHDGEDLGFGK